MLLHALSHRYAACDTHGGLLINAARRRPPLPQVLRARCGGDVFVELADAQPLGLAGDICVQVGRMHE